MNLYRQGLISNPFQKGSSPYQDGIGAWVFTPGMGSDMISKLDGDINGTDLDLHSWLESHGGFPPNLDDRPADVLPAVRFYEGAWSAFMRRWDDFKTDKSPWYNRLWGWNFEAINDYRRELLKLRDAWSRLGIEFVSPTPDQPTESSWSGVGSMLRTIAIVAIVIVGGVFVIWAIGHLRSNGQPIMIRGVQ